MNIEETDGENPMNFDEKSEKNGYRQKKQDSLQCMGDL